MGAGAVETSTAPLCKHFAYAPSTDLPIQDDIYDIRLATVLVQLHRLVCLDRKPWRLFCQTTDALVSSRS